MQKLVILGLVGLVAQLVDGSLGMAYGATSTTLLLTIGIAPAIASASVHLAEVGSTLAAGLSHWRFGNVSWRTVMLMTFPGALGAFLGAVVLSSLSAEIAAPLVAGFLFLLGLYVLVRFTLRPATGRARQGRLPWWFLSPLGLVAGFLDAAGGGGWGPIGTPTLLSSGRLEPRKVVGSIDTAEFFVALGASAGFLLSLGWSQINQSWVIALLGGGIVAAPLAAWLVRLLPPPILGAAVGGLILITNAHTIAPALGVEGPALAGAYAFLTGVWATALVWTALQLRRRPHEHGAMA